LLYCPTFNLDNIALVKRYPDLAVDGKVNTLSLRLQRNPDVAVIRQHYRPVRKHVRTDGSHYNAAKRRIENGAARSKIIGSGAGRVEMIRPSALYVVTYESLT